MLADTGVVLYGLPLATAWSYYVLRRYAGYRRARALKSEATETGINEPVSLHPVIDPAKCIGCRACLFACPEGQIFGAAGHKVEVLAAANCIGHGSCKAACPTSAIDLVYGSEKRGVTLPTVDKNFQTTVPGVYIAGELGGMGLIRNAIEQGRQAIEAIASSLQGSTGSPEVLDVVIVGAGPAGISASLNAKAHGLRFVTLEQDTIGGTVAHYPRRKIVMTNPAQMPMVGEMRFRKVGKEALLRFWSGVLQKVPLPIRTGERVSAIVPTSFGHIVRTQAGHYPARRVLLAMGRRGSPRTLGIPGEELPNVCYRLVEPAQYRGSRVLVVGGGDSALEAAATLAGEAGTTVTLAYRGSGFVRPRQANRTAIDKLRKTGRVDVLLNTEVLRIGPDSVFLRTNGSAVEVKNDAVILCTGGVAPGAFLQAIGIASETKYGTE